MLNKILPDLIGNVKAEGSVFVVKIPPLGVAKDRVSMVDLLELKEKMNEQFNESQ